MRTIQQGTGATRPLVLVFLEAKTTDPALRAAAGPSAMIVDGTEAPGSMYGDVPPLSKIVADLAPPGVTFSPVVVCGFSAGGFATKRILEQGGDPDAVVVADGTYGSTPDTYAAWAAYAKRATDGARVFVTSHTSYMFPRSTWHVLSAISGITLPVAAGVPNRPSDAPVLPLPGPVRTPLGNFIIYSYAGDHATQGTKVLPAMLGEAMKMLGVQGAGGSVGKTAFFVVAAAAALIGGFLVGSRR